MDRRRKAVVEVAMVAAILVLIGLIVARLVAHERALTAQPRFGTPDLHDEVMTIPGRPHDMHQYLSDPESIHRRLTYTYSTNSLGFRGPEWSREKPPGTYRIAVVGECVAFGPGVPAERAWPTLLERELRRLHPGRAIEVLNFSNPEPPPRVLANLRRALELSPDLVLFSPGADIVLMPQHGGGDDFVLWLPQRVYDQALEQYRGVLREALEVARGRAVLVYVTPTFNSFAMPDVDYWIEQVQKTAIEAGCPLVDTSRLVRELERRDGLVFERADDGKQRLVTYAGGAPTVLIEAQSTDRHHIEPALYAYLDEHPGVGPTYSIDENHPTARGHEVIAGEVLRVLRERGLP